MGTSVASIRGAPSPRVALLVLRAPVAEVRCRPLVSRYSSMTDRHLANLQAALGFLQLDPRELELVMLHHWLDCWRGVGGRRRRDAAWAAVRPPPKGPVTWVARAGATVFGTANSRLNGMDCPTQDRGG